MNNFHFDDDYVNICNLLGGYCLGKVKAGNTHCRECITHRLNLVKEEFSEIMGNDWSLFSETESKESEAQPASSFGTPRCCIEQNVANALQEKCLRSES